jgi:hypothetical protein
MFTAALVAGLATMGSFRFDASRALVELNTVSNVNGVDSVACVHGHGLVKTVPSCSGHAIVQHGEQRERS